MPVTADQLRRGRDLRDMDAALKAESEEDVKFVDMTPRPPPITLYSMADGEPVEMPPWIARMAMAKHYTDGRYLFTNDPSEAPEYKLGKVKCFLHKESAERLSELLDEVGIAQITCPAEHLASLYSKRIHAENRHGKRWQALQEYRNEQKEKATEDRAERQLEATLALAGQAAKGKRSKTDDD